MIQERQKIAVDLDGVTWNIHERLLDIYNKKYNTTIKNEDINRWDFFPEERFWVCYKEMVLSINEFKPMNMKIGFYINRLSFYYDISFITHGIYKRENIIEKLRSWNILQELSYEDVILENYKNSKTSYDFNYFIDDNPNMVSEIQEYPYKILLLYTQPWNKYINTSHFGNVIRVNNWEEILNYFI